MGVHPPPLRRSGGAAYMVKREKNAMDVWDPERESKPDYSKMVDKSFRVEMGPVTKRKRINKKK